MIERYLTYLSIVRRYSPRTVEIYQGILEDFFSFVSEAPRSKGSARQNFALRAHPSQPDGWAPPVHEATGGHGSAGQTLAAAAPAVTAPGNLATLGTVRGGTASEAQRWGPKDVSGDSWPLREAISLRFSEERGAAAQYAAEVRPGDTLLEPCAALLKAGAFRLPCARWGLRKLAPSTHLYLSSAAPDNGFFKAWKVQDVLPFGAAAFRQLKQRYPRADVTSRNMPLGSAELQKKIGLAPGGDVHIFACRLADSSSILIVTAPAG